jgi:hypothetical protein
MSCGPGNMSLEHINTYWELVTMSWQSSNVYIEPISMSRDTFSMSREHVLGAC